MKLKKLEVLGFKSFADKTTVHFHEGITAIVGPNGCGKSNIADAFRWVLGEQSAKSLRGNKMYDVIFAGTSTRKPLNIAEVTLTMIDVEGVLPVDYNELSITRRLHRNGESEYLINRRPVRLKDVHDVFLDSGIGKNAFSIFEQGKIDQVISYSPLERRYIFEEAAGILRFLQRKKESLRRLDQTDQNIARVLDIHQEVERHIVVLEKQAEKARLYKEQHTERSALEQSLFVAKWDNLDKRRQGTNARQQEQQELIDKANQSLEMLNRELQKSKNRLSEQEYVLRTRHEDVFKARSQKEIKTREHETNVEQLREAVTKEERWKQELSAIDGQRTKRAEEMASVKTELVACDVQLSEADTLRTALREKVQKADSRVTALREQQQGTQKELSLLVHQERQLEREINENSVRLESHREREERLKGRQKGLKEALEGHTKELLEKKKEAEALAQVITEKKEKLKKLDGEISQQTEALATLRKELDKVKQELRDTQAREKALLRLREAMEGFSSGSKRLLKESGNPNSPLHNKLKGLYEYLLPKKGSEEALSTVMRIYGQTLVAETRADLEGILAYAKQHGLKEYSLLCLEMLPGAPKEAASFLEHVEDSPVARHFLSRIAHHPTTKDALQAASSAWSEEGLYIDDRGVIFDTKQGEGNVFLREAEIKTLQTEREQLEKANAELQEKQNSLEASLQEQQLTRKSLDQEIRAAEMEQVQVNSALQRHQNEHDKAERETGEIDKEIQSLQEAITMVTEALTNHREKHATAKENVTKMQASTSALDKELEELLSGLQNEQRELHQKETTYHGIAAEKRRLEHALNVLEVKETESTQQEKRLREEIAGSQGWQERIRERDGTFDTEMEKVEEALKKALETCSQLEEKSQATKIEIKKIEEQIQEQQNGTKELEKKLYEIGIQAAQIDSSRQALEAELQERHQLDIEDAKVLAAPLEGTVEQAERRLRQLRQKMEEAGDINMTSIEEFEAHKERYDFLNQQLADLNASKVELTKIITQLDTESRKIFKETFATIRENFKKNFAILFNGGEADLQFTETEDVLEAGIEIIARPPSKKMQSISLMSGGEKCMTALALLFAIFEVKPAPFCILDEIDAPLDDSNVQRFVEVVKQFIDSCQFIIITHNKRTMAIADILFGVSMQEKGVSRLLSLEFSEETKPQPALV